MAAAAGAAGAELRCATWNIAAVNNNPFEYWVTHSDEGYNTLMGDVESFIVDPGARDVPVSVVFTPAMWTELRALMSAQGWEGLDEVEARWHSDFSQRRIISGFMKDKGLGDKRLASMPDRVTNSIDTLDQGVVNRPSVISCFAGDMSTPEKWWEEWKRFMFATPLRVAAKGGPASVLPCAMLTRIKRAKYPAVEEAEEAISIPLQTLCQAIFDAILLHIVGSASGGGGWQELKQGMLTALYSKKDANTLSILETSYADADVVFVQEATMAFADRVEAHALGRRYAVLRPAAPSPANQNSLILLSRARWDAAGARDLSGGAMGQLGGQPVSPGDLLLVSADDARGGRYLLASFHGDTNGLASLAVLRAVHAAAQAAPDRVLVFGLDANTHAKGTAKQQGVAEFAAEFGALGYASCWGGAPDPANHTTFNARTYLQAQLQKAVRQCDIHAKGDTGAFIDRNPKDFVLFPAAAFAVASTIKDNTGRRVFTQDTVFPTLEFPSDHAVVYTVLSRTPGKL